MLSIYYLKGVKMQHGALFSYILFNLFLFVLSTFNVEELKWGNYDVDILVTPVKKQESSYSIMHITSKSGQEFQCSLPQLKEDDIPEKEVVKEKEQDVLELLKPMHSSSCLTKVKDWWTYEFCFGHYIKQYHVEDGHIVGQVLTLGLFESDFDWNNETNQDKFKHTKQKYHSQYYVNGTNCDLTGKPRNAEVRIYCEENVGDFIYRVDEPGTCSYIMIVHTSRLCSHPQLKPPPSNKAHPIACNPLLNDEQYSIYLQKEADKKAADEEKRSKWLSTQQERLQSLKNGKDKSEVISDLKKTLLKKTSLPLDKVFSLENDNRLPKLIQDIIHEAKETFDHPKSDANKLNTFKSMVISALNVQLVELLNIEQDVIDSKKSIKTAQSLVSKDKFLNVKDFKTLFSPEKYASLKNEFQVLDDILKEASEDPDLKDKEKTKDSIQSKLKLALDLLLMKLDKAEKDVAESIKKINKVKSMFSEGKEPEPLKVVDKEEGTEPRSATLDDDKLQVRIRRLDRRSSDSSGKLHEMDFEQRKKLEQAVKEKLEKAGLDTGGRKIEVKLITAGYYDNEEGKDFQSLTDEETDQFQNMIMALLTGQQDAVQEMKRHKKLEDSYKFTWDNDEIETKED